MHIVTHLFEWNQCLYFTENQAKAKEAELSDTLSPSKEKSSDDTTGMVGAYLSVNLDYSDKL